MAPSAAPRHPTASPHWLQCGGDARERAPKHDGASLRELLARPGCYTTASVTGGVALWESHHCRRLRRDAAALGIADPGDHWIRRALRELGQQEFGEASGVVRLQACPDPDYGVVLVATPRALGPESAGWHAVVAPFAHSGPFGAPRAGLGAKVSPHSVYDRARALTAQAGVDESLLFDAAGRLVEGGRSNVLVARNDHELITPSRALGAVAGIGLEIAEQQLDALAFGDVGIEMLRAASEIIAVNAVRGPCPITLLDGKPVGEGSAGPVHAKLLHLFAQLQGLA